MHGKLPSYDEKYLIKLNDLKVNSRSYKQYIGKQTAKGLIS